MKSFFRKFKIAFVIGTVSALLLALIFSSPGFAVTSQKYLSARALLKLADNKYADGKVPLGDGKYITT